MKFRIIAENRTVLGGCMIRPDLLLVHQRTSYIVDVTIAFENRIQAFEEARARKLKPLCGPKTKPPEDV